MANTDCYIVDICDFGCLKPHLCRFLVRNRRVKHGQKVLIYSASAKNLSLIACGLGLRVKEWMRDDKCVFLLWLGVMFSLVKSNVLAIKSVADRRLVPMVCAWQIVRISFGKPFVFVSFLS